MSTELMKLPRCSVHDRDMELQIPRTPEQRFVGTMYTCPCCGNSVLIPSAELTAFLKKQKGENSHDHHTP